MRFSKAIYIQVVKRVTLSYGLDAPQTAASGRRVHIFGASSLELTQAPAFDRIPSAPDGPPGRNSQNQHSTQPAA
jgi:hypothetical protein